MNTVWLTELKKRRRKKEIQFEGMHDDGEMENPRFSFSIWHLLLLYQVAGQNVGSQPLFWFGIHRYTMHHVSNPDGDAELYGMDPRR